MTDYFLSRLPAGHPVRSFQRAEASAALANEPLVIVAAEANIVPLRRQCAAAIWIRSDVYSLAALEKLPVPERAYLLKLCGLPGGGASKAQARRIDDHVAKYPAPPSGGGGNGGGGAGAAGGGALGGPGAGAAGMSPEGSSSSGGPCAAAAVATAARWWSGVLGDVIVDASGLRFGGAAARETAELE